jgi:branched-chain amino acid transport system permease protein
LIGPAIGAALIVLLQNIVSGYTERWLIVLGVVYVLVALLAPRGLVGFVRDLHAKKAGP